LAGVYDSRWPGYVTATVRQTLARSDLTAAGSILDVGCGTGTLLEAIAGESDAGGSDRLGLVGVDLSPGMLAEARRKLGARAGTAAADAARLPLRAATFDVALSASSLHHWRDPAAVLAEIRRVLRPGGRLVVTDWCGDRWIERLRTRVLRRRHRDHLRVYRSAELVGLLEDTGFLDVRIERWWIGWRWSLMTATAVRADGARSPRGTTISAPP
jgi:SAM-dependent methyltransferase